MFQSKAPQRNRNISLETIASSLATLTNKVDNLQAAVEILRAEMKMVQADIEKGQDDTKKVNSTIRSMQTQHKDITEELKEIAVQIGGIYRTVALALGGRASAFPAISIGLMRSFWSQNSSPTSTHFHSAESSEDSGSRPPEESNSELDS
ncbi:hypothetical protein MIND_00693700 [Mycena indigotica]|uniref:DUF1664 domain-containing protein n=1 Tax=Mycena indigotica TaxID=2126181 RepID=A0A8H6SKH9_9AGAR|nr:uncharacterized protein MIND_00693700 [Mycena indigotica]KAF7301288.1 hypothetical protein MIND_00693700 [Mycena indigotica]